MPPARTSEAHRQRLSQPYPVLSPSAACGLLPWDYDTAMRWLRGEGLIVKTGDGRECVSWRRVLDKLDGHDETPRAPAASRRGRRTQINLPRDPL